MNREKNRRAAIAKRLAEDAGIATPDCVAMPQSTFRELGAAGVLDAVVDYLTPVRERFEGLGAAQAPLHLAGGGWGLPQGVQVRQAGPEGACPIGGDVVEAPRRMDDERSQREDDRRRGRRR